MIVTEGNDADAVRAQLVGEGRIYVEWHRAGAAALELREEGPVDAPTFEHLSAAVRTCFKRVAMEKRHLKRAVEALPRLRSTGDELNALQQQLLASHPGAAAKVGAAMVEHKTAALGAVEGRVSKALTGLTQIEAALVRALTEARATVPASGSKSR